MPQVGLGFAEVWDTYDKFYEEWSQRALALAHKFPFRDPDGAAQNVLLVLWRKDYVSRWSGTGGRSLDNFIYHLMKLRLISQWRVEKRRADREWLYDELPAAGEQAYTEPGFDRAEGVEAVMRVASPVLRRLAMDDAVSSSRASVPMADLFGEMVRRAVEGLPAEAMDLAEHFGLSASAMRTRRKALRLQLDAMPEARELLSAL